MPSLYESLPLRRERRDIRLVALKPGSFSDDIKCTLTVASLEEKPEYEALSYVWGPASNASRIDVNGYEHSVTENLVKALKYLREGSSEPRVLWIDAISINQSSEEEKSWQVAMMSSIYASCTTANVWLGAEMERGDLTYAGWFSLTRMYPGIDVMMQMTLSLIIELARDHHLDEIYLLDFREGEWDPIDNDPSLALQGINVLLHRPWWERAWVCQEVIIPPKVIVTSGYLQLDWEDFENAAKSIGKHLATCCQGVHKRMKGVDRGYLQQLFNTVTPVSVLRTLLSRGASPLENHSTFLGLWYRFCNRQASLGKDKIFSLYSLLPKSDTVVKALPVDYGVSTDDLCRRVTTALLDAGDLDVLAGDQLPLLAGSSWQRDFTATLSSTQKYLAVGRYAHLHLFPPYQISPAVDDTDPFRAHIMPNDLLAVGGTHVDTIRLLSGRPYPDRQNLDTSYISPWLIMLEDIADGSMDECRDIDELVVSGGQNLKEAFWRTMLGEHTGTKGRVSDVCTSAPEDPESSVEERFEGLAVQDSGSQVEEPLAQAGFETITRLARSDLQGLVEWLPTAYKSPKYENLNRYEEAMLTMVMGRRFAVTQGGYFGLVAAESQIGDEIWVLQGGSLPLVLRKEEEKSDSVRRLVGSCFIHGLIDGEVSGKAQRAAQQVTIY